MRDQAPSLVAAHPIRHPDFYRGTGDFVSVRLAALIIDAELRDGSLAARISGDLTGTARAERIRTQHILRAAEKLILKHGVGALTLKEVASAANMSKGGVSRSNLAVKSRRPTEWVEFAKTMKRDYVSWKERSGSPTGIGSRGAQRIQFALKTGTRWHPPADVIGGSAQEQLRLRDLQEACVSDRLHELPPAKLREAGQHDFSHAAVDSPSVRAVGAGKTGCESQGPRTAAIPIPTVRN